jgi:hypothetical protein
MKKDEKTINFEEIKTPDFSQINDIFENNLKIYNNFVKNISTNTSANKDTQTTNGAKKYKWTKLYSNRSFKFN